MILLIAGPTGSGKSKVAMQIATMYEGEIINGDAFQVYQDLNIGTAKPSISDRKKIPHHLYDFISPEHEYNVKNYQKDVRQAIADILSRNKLPIIVGGTALYQMAGLYDYTFHEENEPVDLSDLDGLSDDDLHNYLQKIDLTESLKIHAHNRKRVLRAIAIFRETGVNKTDLLSQQKHTLMYPHVFMVGFDSNREQLYEKIDARVDEMFCEGLVGEVRTIVEKYGPKHHALQAIGYREVIAYLNNEMSLIETKAIIKKRTRNYAKRQYTFFKNKLPVQWFNSPTQLIEYVQGEVENNE